MNRLTHAAPISRRNLLKAGGGALAAATVVPHLGAGTATAQTPKRGGTLSLRLWDPPHFDPHLTISYKINVLYTFTHSRLLKHKAGAGVTPGTFPIEGDLAESWTQPNETTYIFKLRKGVRWHNKPPVNGRELTADDVKYTFDRFVSEKGNANRAMMAALDKVEVVDKYTVKFTLKEPYVWFLDMISNPMALAIIPKEAVEKFGDLKKPESVIGTGPWMLDSYRPNVGATFVRNPSYFLPGLPYIDKVEVTIDEDNASRMAAFIAGKYDLGCRGLRHDQSRRLGADQGHAEAKAPEARDPGVRRQPDEPHLHAHRQATVQRRAGAARHLARLRSPGPARRRGRGRGRVSTLRCPRPSRSGPCPSTSSGRARSTTSMIPRGPRSSSPRPAIPTASRPRFRTRRYGSTVMVDSLQLLLKYLKDIGIDAKANQQEYGAYIASTFYGKYESMAFGPQTPFLDPDNFLFGPHMPGELKNQSHVNDPVLGDMLIRQRRTADVAKRREVLHDIQRHLAKQQYYVYAPSGVYIGVWDGALKNYSPNLGYDWGGRLTAAWLDR